MEIRMEAFTLHSAAWVSVTFYDISMYHCPSSEPWLLGTSSSLCCMVRCGWRLGCGECGDHGQWAGHRALGLATPVLTSTILRTRATPAHCSH